MKNIWKEYNWKEDRTIRTIISSFLKHGFNSIEEIESFQNNLTEEAKKVYNCPAYSSVEEYHDLIGYREIMRANHICLYFFKEIKTNLSSMWHPDTAKMLSEKLAVIFNKLVKRDKIRRVLLPASEIILHDKHYLVMFCCPSMSVERMAFLKELTLLRKIHEPRYVSNEDQEKAKKELEEFKKITYYYSYNNEYVRKYLNSYLKEEFFTLEGDIGIWDFNEYGLDSMDP